MRSSPPVAGTPPEQDTRGRQASTISQHANSQLLAMSATGPDERSRVNWAGEEWSTGDEGDWRRGRGSSAPSMASPQNSLPLDADATEEMASRTKRMERAPIDLRVHFEDFASQLRAHRHSEYKRRMLEHRRRHLQKAVALSARLQRLRAWVHDGLVELSRNDDSSSTSSFVRVQQHLQELSDVCVSQWNHEIQALDPVNSLDSSEVPPQPESFLHKLTSESQHDCLNFLHAIRSNPRYLVDRFKAISPAQLSALSTSPRYHNLPAAFFASLSQNSGRSSTKRQRILTYSKNLELYASSFERKNAITFLLYNCFGTSEAENQLRLSTWSSICASLFEESRAAFSAIFHQVMSGFVPLGRWPARERIHLFLMDLLQRGAFLVESFDGNMSTTSLQSSLSDYVETDQSREFFEAAVGDFYHILLVEGGIPSMALELAQATISKIGTEHLQSEFRTTFFFQWFIEYFLRIVMHFPENEKMLLQVHISNKTRHRILLQLHQMVDASARQVFLPDDDRPLNPIINACVQSLVNQISAAPTYNPYLTSASSTATAISQNESLSLSTLTVCADDVIHVLEALSQQYNDPVLSSSMSAFTSQYPTAYNGFKKLRTELIVLQEPGFSSVSVPPYEENWLVLPVMANGKPSSPELTSFDGLIRSSVTETVISQLGFMDAAQKAAVRLVFEHSVADGTAIAGLSEQESSPKLLVKLFRDRSALAYNKADTVNALYWNTALETLDLHYPAAAWGHDDSRVLRPLLRLLENTDIEALSQIQSQIARLEDAYSASKRSLVAASKQLHLLKVRLWYDTGVINSSAYEEAKNITRALNYMASSSNIRLQGSYSGSSDRLRPGTSTSTASSMFEQTRAETVSILKAPKEHGGSKKLADEQVEMTKRWLIRSNVENFCKGEERIHRFCMEIRMLTRKLAAETLAESPVLWTSDLWIKEKIDFDIGTQTILSSYGSTRPPSVMSDTYSTSQLPARPPLSSLGFSTRSLDVDTASSQGRKSSLYSLGSSRGRRDVFGSEFAPASSSGQSWTTISGDSNSSAWSPLSSQGRSSTATSMYSRSPSIITDIVTGSHLADVSLQKGKFLEDLQHDLTTLLLSDLGNPVWCQGSETDTWVGSARQNTNVTQQLDRRQQISQLIPTTRKPEKQKPTQKGRRPDVKRRTWSADSLNKDGANQTSSRTESQSFGLALPERVLLDELQDVLNRISYHIDPRMKLDAVYEFKVLALQVYPKVDDSSISTATVSTAAPSPRRRGNSLGRPGPQKSAENRVERREPQTDTEITEYLKALLLALKPRTLFRDLQYIAAFISADTLNKTEKGRAHLLVGLGALACKDEYCRSMVDLADRIVTQDGIKRRIADTDSREEGLLKARDYWILAAREGNRIAQRELAILYLVHPEVPPIISLPMSVSSEVFKNEMMWRHETGENASIQSLCLALHWMQQAAGNGDNIAIKKLEERKGSSSIR